jgi:hypothetical protein
MSEATTETTATTTATESDAAKTVPLAELLKERKSRQEMEAKIKELEAAHKRADDEKLPEAEKIKKQIAEAEALRGEHTAAVALLTSDRDERLTALPEEIRKTATEAIDGLPLAAQLKQLKVYAALTGKTAPRNATVERGGPAGGKRLPTAAEIEANPGLLTGKSFKELQEIAAANGIGTATGNPFGFK